jgi:drug/metabolite transporter (DMT)-like permease
MAMVCGVLYGVLYLRPHGVPNGWVIAGALGTCAALLLIGMGTSAPAPAGAWPLPQRWLPLVIAGGAFSGLSFITQTYIGEIQRVHRFKFLAAGALGAAAILLPVAMRYLNRWSRREIVAGVAIGAMSCIGVALTLAAFAYLGSAIVLPFSVTTPVLLMLVIGHFIYRERLSRAQWAGCLVGTLSVLLLAVGSA